ncbi:tRNA preQ1(34) S-adenosylmethionine ribosyltransferase-isomerase QueA [Asaia lannensis]|uniref:S-adenosylmethionine:tRNA ribosyltransferase-isomerase n=1 Tax=Asaia lannensis NBRC 102526 TaxID=1307926 RepID=A0ABT1CG59_9PROT|nr:tRNA preQ1(34) S-adenosylmethionine ribosyltransferase-isomerase QueA [Asaia lannensis]MCO6159835.1 tRNA preQ1(34) S-adenosylmethionine ribosyltransferase-isomerase QueA [Asaia lannensis NBRC 102526]GBQ96073.1 S-adenosylmethionine:tRNA ribosyltransferase-isomerase [Asaia lannensis NBRC 102526]
MQISDFDFDLPRENIALEPARPRDSARLLRVAAGQPLAERRISDLPSLLEPGDLLIANDTAVIRAQLAAKRGEAKIGITLDRILSDGSWHALAKNARKLRPGDTLHFGTDSVTAEVVENEGDGAISMRFSAEGEAFDAFLKRAGVLALPPYIDRPTGPTAQDDSDYATIFERYKGAVAAPTAGLHFTPDLLAALDARGVKRHTLTLHVGAGTFLPVRDEIASHKMHAEWGRIDAQTAQLINDTRASGRKIVAVGTTSLRLLESAADEHGIVHPWEGETSIFIKPGYHFRAVDRLMTNFHLPRSTLFMLVCALAGTETMRDAYRHAIDEGFRFYSYGDACLLDRAP